MVARDDEQEWIARSRAGDMEAFEALVRRYQQMIHAVTFRMTGSASDAEDLTQETFIAAYDQLAGFKGEARFSSWLYRIATNRCLNWLKRRERQARLHDEWARDFAEESCSGDHAISEAVQSALMKLEAKQRAAIVLTEFEGLTHANAAAALGCSETTVSWRVFVARQKLKRWLDPIRKGGRDE